VLQRPYIADNKKDYGHGVMSHVTDIADKNQNVAPASFEKEDKL